MMEVSVMTFMNRRELFLGVAALAASTVVARANPFYGDGTVDSFIRDPALIPPTESPIDYPVEVMDIEKIDPKFRRQIVEYDGLEDPGTIVVDPGERLLYLVQADGTAIRYGVGVGRAGFAWHGDAYIGMKRKWPRWLPPEEMIVRDLKAAAWANGMPGGPTNPLGARALYLHNNGEDTLFRIHGTTEPQSIGKAMSSGCIRMLNQDVAELFDLVPIKTRVVVRPSSEA
jgi:lipoprotein-anchoring transpeptidase ErfK/SrfK